MSNIPNPKELKKLLIALRDGKPVDRVAILRGAVYQGALSRGYSKKEAFESASSPELATVPVRFQVRYA